MLYTVKINEGEVILETEYVSTVVSTVVFIDELNSNGLERTDDELVKIAKFLTQAYIETKPILHFYSYVEVIKDMETKDILDMDMHKLIKLAIETDSMFN